METKSDENTNIEDEVNEILGDDDFNDGFELEEGDESDESGDSEITEDPEEGLDGDIETDDEDETLIDSDIPNPSSVDDLISEKEKKEGFLSKVKDKVANAFSKNESPKKDNQPKKPNSDGSSPSVIIREQIPVSREENERANLIEQERVLAEHKERVKRESFRSYQFVSPLEKQFENVSVRFKNVSIPLKVKSGIYKLKESDYQKIGTREEFVKCLTDHKFTEV